MNQRWLERWSCLSVCGKVNPLYMMYQILIACWSPSLINLYMLHVIVSFLSGNFLLVPSWKRFCCAAKSTCQRRNVWWMLIQHCFNYYSSGKHVLSTILRCRYRILALQSPIAVLTRSWQSDRGDWERGGVIYQMRLRLSEYYGNHQGMPPRSSKHETFRQCLFDVGPLSTTLTQHKINTGRA